MAAAQLPEAERRRSAHSLSTLLVVLAGVLAVGAFTSASTSRGVLLVEGALAVLAALASGLEWRRSRLAEAFSLAVVVPAFFAAPVLLVWAHWVLGLAQGVTALVCTLALTRRFIVRDEVRHRPRSRGKAA